MKALYDSIGINYADLRQPDPRIASVIHDALGDARRVLNVGAGTGSYEPGDRDLIAVEPSVEMINKRGPSASPVIQAVAGKLPFKNKAFDASMAILTLHHWANKEAGLREMRRVTKGPIVLLTFDPAHRPWLTSYLPELAELDEAQFPDMSEYAGWLDNVTITPVLVPDDCRDGFLYAYWRRPEAYLDSRIRSGSSAFWAIENAEAGLQKLRKDIDSGYWHQQYRQLLSMEQYDAGYRLVVSP